MPRPRTREPKSPEWGALGKAIRDARVDAKLNQREAAADLTSVQHLSEIEGGVDIPSHDLVRKLARRLDVPEVALLRPYIAAVDSEGKGGRLRDVIRQQVIRAEYPPRPTEYFRLQDDGTTQPIRVRQLLVAEMGQGPPTLGLLDSEVTVRVEGPDAGATYVVLNHYRVLVDGVRHVSFWRSVPRGLRADRVEIRILSAGRLAAVHRYAASYRHTVALPKPLASGEKLMFAYMAKVLRPNHALAGIISGGDEHTQRTKLTVGFAEQVPRRVWYFMRGEGSIGPGQYAPSRRLELEGRIVSREFIGDETHGNHGIEWRWGRRGPAAPIKIER